MSYVERCGKSVAALYGFDEIRTPIFEFTETFSRTLGQVTEVVNKQMYTFEDKSGHSLTLRPEGTAGVLRALLYPQKGDGGDYRENRKVCYAGPMFRYERPQRGRQRQFTQFGVESFGHAGPAADIEAIQTGCDFLKRIGLLGSTTLLINTLGESQCRDRYNAVLKTHFEKYKDNLSEDSLLRLAEGRVLRILDSKEPADQEPISFAPPPEETLSIESRERFKCVLEGLDELGIQYKQDPHLVRGLDYYSHTTFEFVLEGKDKGGNASRPLAILAGGRYDGLAGTMGFPLPVPAVGWAAGLERLCLERARMSLERAGEVSNSVFILPLLAKGSHKDEVAGIKRHANDIACKLRENGIPAQVWLDAFDSKPGIKDGKKKGFKMAERCNSSFVVLVDHADAERGSSTVKCLASKSQTLHETVESLVNSLGEF
eukprot:CAMPEP_0203757044 /NCGR_PEP_ID=MMETSP0098-20131031/10209_1 /ASSEMBLY_ACC=CAM_ASM_000208 /TAXON_ID=96639 /ORGANISM=" , Strain NY0313808BC1" /LENGTH=429 /DNA_ID=CAMNT_0050649145 /DNA_START=236 /DNA_END=1525 /DNA_ORIENTATION=-